MVHWRVLALLTTLLGAACGQTGRLQAPYAPGPRGYSTVDFSRHDSIAAAVGLPSLRMVVLPVGWREVRVSTGWNWIWQPEALVRVLVSPSGDASGSVVRYWRAGEIPPQFRDPATGVMQGCGTVGQAGGIEACVLPVLDNRMWRVLADSLDRLRAWELPTAWASTGDLRSHAPNLWIELRDGAEYRGMYYRDIAGTDSVAIRARAVLRASGVLPVKQ